MEQSVNGSQCTIDWCPRQGKIGHGGNQNEFPLCAPGMKECGAVSLMVGESGQVRNERDLCATINQKT